MKYDYLIVGSGLFGATFAQVAKEHGKRVLVVERREHIAGNAYTENIAGINVHKYGAHILHTNNQQVWQYLQRFATFNRFTNSPLANYKGELYSLPFNMFTFYKMWGASTPDEARDIIERQKKEVGISFPQNLEEQAISLVGRDIYERLIKGYTEKQWGRDCKKLPAFIIKRLPVRFSFDNNYFNASYQGIPIGGYTKMVENMLSGIEVRLGVDYLCQKDEFDSMAKTIIYTGPIDEYYGYCFGPLEYRSLRFDTVVLNKSNYQGNAVINYTDKETPWTRIIEHKWFECSNEAELNSAQTVITKEFSQEWSKGDEPYYPINDEKNAFKLSRYKQLAQKEEQVVFCGRLGCYLYLDMDQIVASSLQLAATLLE